VRVVHHNDLESDERLYGAISSSFRWHGGTECFALVYLLRIAWMCLGSNGSLVS
jgi:hypothetical protein